MPRIPKKKTRRRVKPHPLYPEPGANVLDDWSGMPKIKPPESLPKGKLTASQVQDYVTYEGLGFCVYSYIPSGKIADGELKELWETAREALFSLVSYMDKSPRPKKTGGKKRIQATQKKCVSVVDDLEEL